MKLDNRRKLGQTLQIINIIPLLIFGALTLVVSHQYYKYTMYNEVKQELKYVANNVNTLVDMLYPGDYIYNSDTQSLYKGKHNITSSHELVDEIKADTNLEITLFYQETRILTTLYSRSSSTRIIGTQAPDNVIEDVLNKDEDEFYNKVSIYDSFYFSYYMPLHNSDGSIVGMIFVGKPTKDVNAAIQQSLYPIFVISLLSMLIISLFLFFYTHRLVRVLRCIRTFLLDVSTGDLDAELDFTVTQRKDEFGDIGRSAVSMQNSLRTLVEQDALTGLLNRRSANRKLKNIIRDFKTSNTPFCVAIGDIDFFKKVNDTYGHDCGDMILKEISAQLDSHMHQKGFVARWGGEEFLLVYENSNIREAYNMMETLLNDIRNMENPYDGQIIKITMTLGLTEGNSTDMTQILRNADQLLYKGKTEGRNQIVCDDPELNI